jgi:hypothetical protein
MGGAFLQVQQGEVLAWRLNSLPLGSHTTPNSQSMLIAGVRKFSAIAIFWS